MITGNRTTEANFQFLPLIHLLNEFFRYLFMLDFLHIYPFMDNLFDLIDKCFEIFRFLYLDFWISSAFYVMSSFLSNQVRGAYLLFLSPYFRLSSIFDPIFLFRMASLVSKIPWYSSYMILAYFLISLIFIFNYPFNKYFRLSWLLTELKLNR